MRGNSSELIRNFEMSAGRSHAGSDSGRNCMGFEFCTAEHTEARVVAVDPNFGRTYAEMTTGEDVMGENVVTVVAGKCPGSIIVEGGSEKEGQEEAAAEEEEQKRETLPETRLAEQRGSTISGSVPEPRKCSLSGARERARRVSMHPWFDHLMLGAILANSALMAYSDPRWGVLTATPLWFARCENVLNSAFIVSATPLQLA